MKYGCQSLLLITMFGLYGCHSEDGPKKIKTENTKLTVLMEAAKEGDPKALFELADSYLTGNGVKVNKNAAKLLFKKAAKQHYLPAMLKLGEINQESDIQQSYEWYYQASKIDNTKAPYELALMLLNKKIVAADSPISYLIVSAKAGYVPAQFLLGQFYQEGLHVEQNASMAFTWYLEAANQNEPQSAYEVGMAYLQGSFNQPKNLERGMHYLQKSASLHYYPAQYVLAQLEVEGVKSLGSISQAIEYLYPAAAAGETQAQIKLAQALALLYEPEYDVAALHWLEKAAEKEDLSAIYLLGTFYYDGIGTPVNHAKAFEIFSQMAIKNHALAQFKMGQMHYYGQGTDKDVETAKAWLLKATRAKVEDANILLATILKEENESIENVDPHFASAASIEIAVREGDPKGLYLKGIRCLHGSHDFEQNSELGMALIIEAANQNVILAQRELSKIYLQGLYGFKNVDTGFDWLLKASKNGDNEAQLEIAQYYYNGQYGAVDYIQAYAFAQAARILGNTQAAEFLAEITEVMTESEIAKANYLAFEYSQTPQTRHTLSYYD